MGDLYYERRNEHHCHEQDPTFAAAEVLAAAMLLSAARLAEAIEGITLAEPEWATRLEQQMGDIEEATGRLTSAIAANAAETREVSDAIKELISEIPDPETAEKLNSLAEQLESSTQVLEEATDRDDPAPEPDPTEPAPEEPAPGEPAPTEPLPGETPGEPAPVPNEGGIVDAPAGPVPTEEDPGTPPVPNEGGVIEAPSDPGDNQEGDLPPA